MSEIPGTSGNGTTASPEPVACAGGESANDGDDPCDDGLECTIDACSGGTCVHELLPSSCLIDGECYEHNGNDPENACRYCDTTIDAERWTNWPSTVTCDDDVWCNGTDICDGAGHCVHEFPDENRCTESGSCALEACDEERRTCYASSTTVCDESEREVRCSTTQSGCGGSIEWRGVTRYCSGSSPDCDGEVIASDVWESDASCEPSQVCGGVEASCQDSLECVAWCDPATDLCWLTSNSPEPLMWEDALSYCEDGRWGGVSDWRLPDLGQWLTIFRGCREGAPTGTFDRVTCRLDPPDCVDTECRPASITGDCSACPEIMGPGEEGCYWPAELGGSCSDGFWSSTTEYGPWHWIAYVDESRVFYGAENPEYVRCVYRR